MVIVFVLVYAGGKEKEVVKEIRKVDFIEEANVVYFGEGELAIVAKLLAPNMTKKEAQEFVKNNIRSMDAVTSTGTMPVVPPEEKPKLFDLNLIIKEKGNWGPWR